MKFTWKNDHMEIDLGYRKLKIAENEEQGFLPIQLFISSIVGCNTYLFDTILKKQKINYNYLTVKTEVEKNNDNNTINKISLNFIIEGENLKKEKLLKNLKLSRKYCGMAQSIKDSIKIEDTLTIK